MILNLDPVIYGCERCNARRPVAHGDTRVPMHNCGGRAGMSVPMVREGSKDHVRLVEREDYVGQEVVRKAAEGRVFMRAEVETEDTVNVWVYAPVARTSVTA